MNLPFEQEQLDFVVALANHRVELLNPFFRFLNYFDTPYFVFILIPIIWLGFSYKWGIRIFYWLILNNVINSLLKIAFGFPRPIFERPDIGMFHPTSFGFPSGGAQTCMFLGVLLIYFWRRPLAWVIAVPYIVLISFSRLYLGVHYPLDILGGWFFALVLLTILIATKKPLERFLAHKGPLFCLVLGIVIPLLGILFIHKQGLHYVMGCIIGISIGIYISVKYKLYMPNPATLFEAIGRSFIGLFLLFLLILLWPQMSQSILKSLSVALLMSLVASPLCSWTMARKLSSGSHKSPYR